MMAVVVVMVLMMVVVVVVKTVACMQEKGATMLFGTTSTIHTPLQSCCDAILM